MTKLHEPTDETRHQVEIMAAAGIDQVAVARVMGLSKTTLIKHYRRELKYGATKTNAAVAGALFDNVMRGNVAAQIFWCKTRLGWKETKRVEIDNPVEVWADTVKAALEKSDSSE